MTITSSQLKTLDAGSLVVVNRDLNDPAWDNQDAEEFLDVLRVLDATADQVYLTNHIWYDRETGIDTDTGSTYITEVSNV